MLGFVIALLGDLLLASFGPRHEPPREDTRVLGDLAPRRRPEGS